MRKGLLKDGNGKVITTINLPEHLGEMRLDQYINFIVATEKEGSPLELMLNAISEFSGQNLNEALSALTGNIYTEARDLDGTVSGIYGCISNLIKGYRDELRDESNHVFTYKGQTRSIPIIRAANALTGVVLPPLEVGENIEVLELERAYNGDVETTGNPGNRTRSKILNEAQRLAQDNPNASEAIMTAGKNLAADEVLRLGDPNGSKRYMRYLTLIAILGRQEGVKLPLRDAERARFIANEVEFLQEIDAHTALSIDFFLSPILEGLNKTHKIAGSLKALLFAHGVETTSWSERRTKGRRSTTKKSLPASVGIN